MAQVNRYVVCCAVAVVLVIVIVIVAVVAQHDELTHSPSKNIQIFARAEDISGSCGRGVDAFTAVSFLVTVGARDLSDKKKETGTNNKIHHRRFIEGCSLESLSLFSLCCPLLLA